MKIARIDHSQRPAFGWIRVNFLSRSKFRVTLSNGRYCTIECYTDLIKRGRLFDDVKLAILSNREAVRLIRDSRREKNNAMA